MERPDQITREMLNRLEPIASLDERYLREIMLICAIEQFEPGNVLFRTGDRDGRAIYVLSGTVRLFAPGSDKDVEYTVTGDSAEATYPIADVQPREVTAVAASDLQLLRLPSEDLDSMISRDHLTKAQAAASSRPWGKGQKPAKGWLGGITKKFSRKKGAAGPAVEKDRWHEIIGKSEVLKVVPLKNVPKLVTRMKPRPVKAGELVIKQGQEGDCYYLIVEGSAIVSRRMEGYSRAVPVAELSPGSGFGEEALISNTRCNATVTMKTDGVLARLSKMDFAELLKEPILMWISQKEAQARIAQGAKWLDVRSPSAYERSRLSQAVSMPLHDLRRKAADLDKETLYICYCQNGRLSSTAAFLLKQLGFHAAVLRGGVRLLPGFKA